MGIGSVTSMNSMSDMQMTMVRSTDSESKNIQNEITGIQQKMQKLSSEEELSVDEKANERKKLQKKISSLNIELKQHQEELRRSQRRKMIMEQLQDDKELTEEEKSEDRVQAEETTLEKSEEKNLPIDNLPSEKSDENKEEVSAEQETKATGTDNDMSADTGLSRREMYAITSADTSVQQASRQGTVIARIRGGIVIYKGEINQDEKRGIDTEKKQAEVEKMEEREQRARAFQTSVLGEANSTIRSAAKAEMNETKNNLQVNAQDKIRVNTENNAIINAFKVSKEEEQALQQSFYISLDH